ncbi:hypothetical protein [Azohydromonas australica]|uniref:hypothetical protein n=1 Tax=Azohydromonas australica TaxID=364039 RepID=UPI0012EC3CFB|nr:hypothetical protein [Azohydromonas australica]
MKRLGRMAVLWLALCSGAAWTQQETESRSVPQASDAVKYLSGGAGDEERSQLMAQWPQFPLLIVFSADGGAYAVPDSVRIANAQGAPLLEVGQAGPLLMVNLPPGDYRVQARIGGTAQERSLHLGSQPQRLDWRM